MSNINTIIGLKDARCSLVRPVFNGVAQNLVVHKEHFVMRSLSDSRFLGAVFAQACALENYSAVEGVTHLSVGLIGRPGVGKSTFVSAMSNAFYDFTFLKDFELDQRLGQSEALGKILTIDAYNEMCFVPQIYYDDERMKEGGIDIVEHADQVKGSFNYIVNIWAENKIPDDKLRTATVLCNEEMAQTFGFQNFLRVSSHLRCS